MSPLRISSGGGVAVRAYDSLIPYSMTSGGGFVYCIVDVAWEIWLHLLSVIVVETLQNLGWEGPER